MIIGCMAVHNFSLAHYMAFALSLYCDKVILRFDSVNGDKRVFKRCMEAIPEHKLVSFTSKQGWNRWNWREELTEAAGEYKPEIILFPDSDECFSPGFEFDLEDFRKSEAGMLMFKTQMVTQDGRIVSIYPKERHCKVFKWEKGVNFQPYQKFARPNLINNLHNYKEKQKQLY